jgi:16S rRNA (guanine(1405)-N(7))-methyltransferase
MVAEVEEIVAAVRASSKYHRVAEDFIRKIAAQEMAKRDGLKDAIKSTKNKLHQVGGAYLDGSLKYDAWLRELEIAAQSGGMSALRPFCARIMNQHASTRERLTILERFYAETLADLPPIHSVLDVACGFNPLALPWMPLRGLATYMALDIYEDLLSFVGRVVNLCGFSSQTFACSALDGLPANARADLALLLKAIPCLEQVDKPAAGRLLEQIDARHILVSFPVHSLGGRSKGMASNYEAHFEELVKAHAWSTRRFEFPTELAFLVTK